MTMSALIVGAAGGIGAALARALCADPAIGTVHGWAREAGTITPHARLCRTSVDCLDEDQIQSAAATLENPGLVIIATGMLHSSTHKPEKSWKQLTADGLGQSFAANTIAPALVLKHVLPRLDRSSPARLGVLSARVGSISDNELGGWYGYRASKAALNQIIKTAAIELARKWPEAALVGIHPGTVDTGLSAPFQAGVKHPIFTPDEAASRLLAVLKNRTAQHSGRCFDFAGAEIPA